MYSDRVEKFVVENCPERVLFSRLAEDNTQYDGETAFLIKPGEERRILFFFRKKEKDENLGIRFFLNEEKTQYALPPSEGFQITWHEEISKDGKSVTYHPRIKRDVKIFEEDKEVQIEKWFGLSTEFIRRLYYKPKTVELPEKVVRLPEVDYIKLRIDDSKEWGGESYYAHVSADPPYMFSSEAILEAEKACNKIKNWIKSQKRSRECSIQKNYPSLS